MQSRYLQRLFFNKGLTKYTWHMTSHLCSRAPVTLIILISSTFKLISYDCIISVMNSVSIWHCQLRDSFYTPPPPPPPPPQHTHTHISVVVWHEKYSTLRNSKSMRYWANPLLYSLWPRCLITYMINNLWWYLNENHQEQESCFIVSCYNMGWGMIYLQIIRLSWNKGVQFDRIVFNAVANTGTSHSTNHWWSNLVALSLLNW